VPKRMAVIDYEKCHPEKCDEGICDALSACPRPDEIFIQEAPDDYPYIIQDLCRGCGDCSRICRAEAIRMM
jgi:ATP-binding cassette subfamily E protein 1